MSYENRLKMQYLKQVIPVLMEKFQYKSVMEAPRLLKISINQGIGSATQDKNWWIMQSMR